MREILAGSFSHSKVEVEGQLLDPNYMEKSCSGQEGHLSSQCLSERLYGRKIYPFARGKSWPRMLWSSHLAQVDSQWTFFF